MNRCAEFVRWSESSGQIYVCRFLPTGPALATANRVHQLSGFPSASPAAHVREVANMFLVKFHAPHPRFPITMSGGDVRTATAAWPLWGKQYVPECAEHSEPFLAPEGGPKLG